MNADSGVDARRRCKVDGGMAANNLLMQFQADLLGVPVVRPKVAETTVAGRGLRGRPGDRVLGRRSRTCARTGSEDKRWEPTMDASKRDEYYKYWKKAVTRTFDWFEAEGYRGIARDPPESGGRAEP